MFCVRCGQEAPLREGLCADCFLAKHTLISIPSVVRVEVCATCGARHRGGSWGDPLPDLDKAIVEEVRGAIEVDGRVGRWEMALDGGEHDPTNFEYDVVVRGDAQGIAFEIRKPTVVHVQRSTCTRCGRRAGGYYESILQVRADDRPIENDERDHAGRIIERALADMRAGGDLDSFLVKAKEVRGGWDFYFGTVHAARNIAKSLQGELGAVIKETASLVGRDKTGIDLYRVTFSVKLPRARVGGFVVLDDRLFAVMSMGPKLAILTDLEEHRRVTRQRNELAGATVLRPADAIEAVVVSESARELQILDPDSLRTVDVLKPMGFPSGRKTVHVIRWGERLWLLPDAAKPASR
jgi:60S ribosomal export protein NMD3